MKAILIIGAGRSSSALVSHLLSKMQEYDFQLVVGDIAADAARARVGDNHSAKAIRFDIQDPATSRSAIAAVDIVISMLPAFYHPLVAKICLQEGKHLLTASYVSDDMTSMHQEALAKNLLFLNECGLDPGIDHMSAMQVIERIKQEGGNITSFESFTGGLIAPDTDPDNPWRYKFTWNPRNVVMAGQGTAKFLQEGKHKYIPYQQIFQRLTSVEVPGYGRYEGYANRDSLKYLETYQLQGIKTMLRGTLRNEGYSKAWNVLVQLGCCDDTYQLDDVDQMTHYDFINSFLDYGNGRSAEENMCLAFWLSPTGEEMKKFRWSGLFTQEKIGLTKGTPAQILEHILNKKWKLSTGDKDFIVMWHRFRYELKGEQKEIQAYLTSTGDDEVYTAMAKTVGLPLAIAAILLLDGKIKSRGVVMPVIREIYEPVLLELKNLGIELKEEMR